MITGRLPRQTKFVRVHGKDNPGGTWVMRAEDIEGLTPKQIQERFQLPTTPSRVSTITVPKDTSVRVGGVSPSAAGRGGNVVQYEIKAWVEDDWISNTQELTQWLKKNSK